MDYFGFSSPSPEGPDTGEGISSFSIGKVPLSFSVDPPPEFLEATGAGQRRYAGPLFYSLFIHSFILFLLLAVLYQPDRRPVKEVSHWVVNLVSTVKDGPTGPKTILPEEPHAVAGPIQPTPEPPAPPSMELKSALEDRFLPFQESALDQPASPAEEKRAEEPVVAMQQSADHQLQAGQYLFRMRMGDRMIGMKMKYFQQTATAQLNGSIQSAIPEDLRKTMQGKSTVVRILYQEDGTLQEIIFDSPAEDPFIQTLKDGIKWDTLNTPRKFGLPFREMQVRIAIDPEGKPSSRITLL